MEEKLTLTKKIGNFISNLLLGDTKETIIRTDEKVKGIGESVAEIKTEIKGLGRSLSAHGSDIQGLKVHTKYGITNSLPFQANREIDCWKNPASPKSIRS